MRHAKNSVIVLEQRLVKSRAWLSLSGIAPQIYTIFRTKCQIGKRRNRGKRDGIIIENNGEICFTYGEAKSKYGIIPSRFKRAIDQLLMTGFIDVIASGMGVHKVATLYAISERWRAFGTSNYISAERPKPSIRNFGFRKGNTVWTKARKKKTTVTNAHGAVRTNRVPSIRTMRTTAHGQKEANVYKYIKGQWLCTITA